MSHLALACMMAQATSEVHACVRYWFAPPSQPLQFSFQTLPRRSNTSTAASAPASQSGWRSSRKPAPAPRSLARCTSRAPKRSSPRRSSRRARRPAHRSLGEGGHDCLRHLAPRRRRLRGPLIGDAASHCHRAQQTSREPLRSVEKPGRLRTVCRLTPSIVPVSDRRHSGR
jgi:hypothetical protein